MPSRAAHDSRRRPGAVPLRPCRLAALHVGTKERPVLSATLQGPVRSQGNQGRWLTPRHFLINFLGFVFSSK